MGFHLGKAEIKGYNLVHFQIEPSDPVTEPGFQVVDLAFIGPANVIIGPDIGTENIKFREIPCLRILQLDGK